MPNGNSKYAAAAAVLVGVMFAATLLAWADDWGKDQWKIRPSLSTERVHFTVRQANTFGNWTNSRDVPLDRFRGFSLAMLATPGPAKFEYVGDAGRLICEGRFTFGGGSGAYTFAPNSDFVRDLQQMGYSTPDQDQLFSMLLMDVDRRFARDVRDAGLKASTRELVELRIHGIDMDYIGGTRAAGYPDLTAQDYVQLKIHGVGTDFLRDLKDAGYNLRSRDIVELRIHGVDSGYMRELKSYGLSPSPADLTQLRIHGVTPQYLKGLKDAGFATLRSEEITQLRIHGVEPDFARAARDLGYDFTPEELVQLRIHGVDASYLRKLQDSGMRKLSAGQIAQLRIHGVE